MLGLLNLYRLAIPSVLVALALLATRPQTLGAASPTLYFYALVAWFATGVICIGLLKTRWPSLQAQAFIHVAFDIVAVTALLVTSGGAASGAGLLLIMPVAGVSLLLPKRIATTVAAIAALCVLGQQIMLWFRGVSDSSDLTQAGLLGGVILIAALAGAPLAGRLRESEALVRQRDLDLANLADLSQYIVERLRESLVVVDEQDRIRLINESARQILGGDATANALLGEVSPRLLYLLDDVAPERSGHRRVRRQPARGRRPARSAAAFRAARQGPSAAGADLPGGPHRPRRPHPPDRGLPPSAGFRPRSRTRSATPSAPSAMRRSYSARMRASASRTAA